MTISYSKEDVVGFECKHTHYVEANDRSPNDLLFVKGQIHLKDGRRVPHTFFQENLKRPFWITRELHRNHKDKKEWEYESKLMRYDSTQVNLVKNAARALGRAIPMNGQLRSLARSPYLYGCDITPGALMKRHFMDKYPELVSHNTVAVSDTETDVLLNEGEPGYEEIIMQSTTFKNRVYFAATKSFFKGWDLDKVPGLIREAMERYAGKYMAERKIELEIELLDNAGQVASENLKRLHEWKPDFLTFWNMDFDISKMEQALVNYGFDPAREWSDPSIPERYRSYNYKRGANQKKTASGKVMPLSPAEQWHTVYAPSSFYVLDSMCVYLKMRIAKGKQPSYALNSILAKELKDIQKLDFDKVNEAEDGKRWHQIMQREHKIEYCAYNIFDCIAVELLDEKTTDLAMQISSQCEHSEYFKFPSQPRRTCDDLHFIVQEHGRICATTSDEMVDELDGYLLGHDNWIVTLRSDLIHDDGIELIEELPGFKSMYRRDVADLDVGGTYPNEEWLFNISKETTANELCRIVGVPESLQRATGINLSGGYVNAVETYTTVFGAPNFDQVLAYYRGEDILPPEFDDMMRQLASRVMYVDDLAVDDGGEEDEDEETVEI